MRAAFLFPFWMSCRMSSFLNELTVLCRLSHPKATEDKVVKNLTSICDINKCHTYSSALSPGINSSKMMAGSPCLSLSRNWVFRNCWFEMSFTHKHSCHKGKLFFPMLCFEKPMGWNTTLKTSVDSLLFKCKLSMFLILPFVALMTSYQTKQLRIQEKFQDNVFLEVER